MKNKLLLSLLCMVGMLIGSCKNGCMECTGVTAPREYCEDDYTEKGDYQAEISAYETAGGVCEDS